MMTCPDCPGAPKLEVTNTRPRTYGKTETLHRARRCIVCKKVKFHTVEVPAAWADDLFNEE